MIAGFDKKQPILSPTNQPEPVQRAQETCHSHANIRHEASPSGVEGVFRFVGH